MSIALMTKAWSLDITSTQKIVLLALCDCANDQGGCYPSISNLQKKCSLKERSIQNSISELEKIGLIQRDFRNGRSTIYWIKPDAPTPARNAPPHEMHPAPDAPTPARNAPPPPHHVHPTPAPRAPRNVIEPSSETSRKRQISDVSILLTEFGITGDLANDFVTHRKSCGRGSKGAPITRTVLNGFASEAKKAGISIQQAIEISILRNWQSFNSGWNWQGISATPQVSRTPNTLSKSEAQTERNKQNISRWLEKMEAENETV